MRNVIRTTMCAAIAACATAAIAAQTPTPSQPRQPSAAGSGKTVVVTGCLKEAPPSPAPPATTAAPPPTSGAPEAANAPKYVLTNATLSAPETAGTTGAAPTGTAGTTGTTGTPESTATAAAGSSSPQTYRLIANMSALTPHLGKKLALTGVIESQATASAADPAAGGPALRVQSGKIVAEKCE